MNYNFSVLPNGLRVVTQYIPDAVSFSLGICINSGSRDDFEGCDGLAHFVEHTVFRRTKRMNSRQISEEFENKGAYSNAYTTKESICLYVKGLKEYFTDVLRLMYEISFEPVFAPEDIEKERSIIIEEIKSYYDDPEELIIDYGDSVLYKNSRLEHPILGSEKSVKSISYLDIRRFHSQFFKPSNMLISCVGNISSEEMLNALDELFAQIPASDCEKPRPELPLYIPGVQILPKDYAQNHFFYCRRVCNFTSDDRFPLMALNFILGDGVSSRLNQRIREQLGLVYTVYSSLQCFSDSGVLSIYAGSETGSIEKIAANIETEINKLLESNVTPAELARAKTQLKSTSLMSVENYSNFMQDTAKSVLLSGNSPSISEMIEKIEAISENDISKIIDKYLKISEWSKIIFKIN